MNANPIRRVRLTEFLQGLRDVHGNNAAARALNVFDVGCCDVRGLQGGQVSRFECVRKRTTYAFACVWTRVGLGEDADDRGVIGGRQCDECAGQYYNPSKGRHGHEQWRAVRRSFGSYEVKYICK